MLILDINTILFGSTNVTQVNMGNNKIWPASQPVPYADQYLTFEILSGGTIEAYAIDGMDIRKNGGEWQKIPQTSYTGTFTVLTGDKVEVRSRRFPIEKFTSGSTAVFNIYGNILSAEYGDAFTGRTDATILPGFEGTKVISAEHLVMPTTVGRYCCSRMFSNCADFTTAPVLPATTLGNSCYWAMFEGCTSLTSAPVLPATALSEGCYASMFQGCSSLTTAPALPATALSTRCYWSMFNGCTSLISAPELLADTLVESCYWAMFSGCTNLNFIKCLASDISATDCTNAWVNHVAATGTFVKKSGVSWTSGSNGIPSGWTVINE